MQGVEATRPPLQETPPVHMLDPRKLKLLRSESNAEVKNDLMMYVLTRSEWFEGYRSRLDEYRKHGGPSPEYPSDRVDRVEGLVDNLIRVSMDPGHVR